MVVAETVWTDAGSILTSRLTGAVSVVDVERWTQAFAAAASAIPPLRAFRVLFDQYGYEPAEIAAHKAMRNVIPLFLAAHGMRPAVADLFDAAPAIPVAITEGKICVAFAHVHHDVPKMSRYDQTIGRPNQRFFSDLAVAKAWIERS